MITVSKLNMLINIVSFFFFLKCVKSMTKVLSLAEVILLIVQPEELGCVGVGFH